MKIGRVREILVSTSSLTVFFVIWDRLWPRHAFFPQDGKAYRRTFMSPCVTKVGIVYGAKSGHVRQHVYSETDDSEYRPEVRNLQRGEAICFVPIVFHHAGHAAFWWAIREEVHAHSGIRAVLFAGEPGARMFAQVNRQTGIVENIVMADPDVAGDRAVIVRDNWFEHEFGSMQIGDVWPYEQRLAA